VLKISVSPQPQPLLIILTYLKKRSKEKFFHCPYYKKLYLRIWFDVLTPKQVMFFKPAVEQLQKNGEEVLCTSRKYREAVELAKIKQLDIKIIGSHGGADRYEKLRQSAKRAYELADAIKQFAPDIAITFSSPEAARVAFGLGIRHIGFSDSPHAKAVSKLTVPLMTHLFCPWVIPYSAWDKCGISRNSIIRYKGLDPVAWIRRIPLALSKPRSLSSSTYSLLSCWTDLNNQNCGREKTILVRPEESQASYITEKKIRSRIHMIDKLLDRFSNSTNIIILCRNEDQFNEITEKYKGKAHVLRKVTDAFPLIVGADLFIGAGGTMTAEASLLGKPTISIAPIRFYVEKYLVSSGLVKRAADSREVAKLAEKMINDKKYIYSQQIRAKRILDKMEDPVYKMLSFINNMPRSS
jgi:predicted glycosyltransferase